MEHSVFILTKKIQDDHQLYVAADKTNNFCRINAVTYNKLLADNTTKTYIKASPESENTLNIEQKHIAKELITAST